MIKHIVLFKFKPETTSERIEACSAALASLRDRIEAISQVSVGQNFSTRAQGYQIGLSLEFESTDDLEAYQNHPEHRLVIEKYVTPYLLDIIAVDYKY